MLGGPPRLGLLALTLLGGPPRLGLLALTLLGSPPRLGLLALTLLGRQAGLLFLEPRLLSTYRLLREPTSKSRKISDIATAAGFSDISYFNRAFRARFGATPTDIRAGLDGGGVALPLAGRRQCDN